MTLSYRAVNQTFRKIDRIVTGKLSLVTGVQPWLYTRYRSSVNLGRVTTNRCEPACDC